MTFYQWASMNSKCSTSVDRQCVFKPRQKPWRSAGPRWVTSGESHWLLPLPQCAPIRTVCSSFSGSDRNYPPRRCMPFRRWVASQAWSWISKGYITLPRRWGKPPGIYFGSSWGCMKWCSFSDRSLSKKQLWRWVGRATSASRTKSSKKKVRTLHTEKKIPRDFACCKCIYLVCVHIQVIPLPHPSSKMGLEQLEHSLNNRKSYLFFNGQQERNPTKMGRGRVGGW